MDHTERLKGRLPFGASVETTYGPDGDIVPVAVSYPTEQGGKRRVAMERTLDGDFAPETGYTPDGDYDWPGKRWDL